MRAKELQDYNWNTSTTHSIAYCLLLHKQGACHIPIGMGKSTAQYTQNVTTLLQKNIAHDLTYIYKSIVSTLIINTLHLILIY